MRQPDPDAEPFLTWAIVAGLFLSLLFMTIGAAQSRTLALGDSLALGFGQASHLPTRAIVGISSCRILGMTPREHFSFVLLSAGTNDPPGGCIEAIRHRLSADRVQWVVPVNGARSHVLAVAGAHGDATLFYTPGARAWPHPAFYFDVSGRHRPPHHRRKRRHARRR